MFLKTYLATFAVLVVAFGFPQTSLAFTCGHAHRDSCFAAIISSGRNLGLDEIVGSGRFPGWFGGGKGFTVELDTENARTGNACVRSERVDSRGRFCGLSQRISAEPYRGRTIRFTGYIRTKDVSGGGSGLWMRIDGPNRNTLGFDNMDDRPILGTQNWAQYAIEMEVPPNSRFITFGYLLKGGGIAWADDYAIETLD